MYISCVKIIGVLDLQFLRLLLIFIDAFIIIRFSLLITTFGHLDMPHKERSSNNVAILNFSKVSKSQYTYAKPILDKYGLRHMFCVQIYTLRLLTS